MLAFSIRAQLVSEFPRRHANGHHDWCSPTFGESRVARSALRQAKRAHRMMLLRVPA